MDQELLAGSPVLAALWSGGVLMGLPVQTFDLQFLKGLQTKVDPKLQLQGELSELENAVFDRVGRLDKRTGYSALNTTVTNGTNLGTSPAYPRTLATFRDQLLAISQVHLYSYADSIDQWKLLSANTGCASTRVVNREIHQDTYQQLNPAVAYSGGMEVHVFESSEPNAGASYSACYKVIDSLTGSTIRDTSLLVGGSYRHPKVFVHGSNFVCVYHDPVANRVGMVSVAVSSMAQNGFGSDTAITTSHHATNSFYDASVSGTQLYVCYVNTSNQVKYRSISTSLVVSSEFTHDNTSRQWQFLSTWCDSSNRLWLADGYDDGGTKHLVRYAVYTSAGSTTVSATNLFRVDDSPGLYRVAGCAYDSSNSIIYAEQNSASTRDVLVYNNFANASGTVQNAADSPQVAHRSVGIASKPWLLPTGETAIVLAHESELQTTYFVFNNSRILLSKFCYGNAGGLELDKFCNHVATKQSGTYLIPNTIKGAIRSETGVFFSLLGVNCTTLEFDPSTGFDTCELGDNLIVASGLVRCFDGTRLFEQSFHLYPEGATGVASNGSGLLSVDSTYRYRFVYSHVDSNGNQHRSTPSVALAVATGATDDTITLTIPTLRITNRASVTIDVYRTTAGGSVYYKLTGIGDTIYNNTSANTVTYVDEYADSEITSNEPLYTEGALANSSPPAASLCATFKNRVWLAGLEDPLTIWYSKLNGQNESIDFNDAQTMRVVPNGGKIQDLIPFGEQLIVAKESALYTITGEGPNNAGGQGINGEVQYLNAQCLTTDVGVKYPHVWCEIPSGILFVSDKGIQLLDRQNGITPIGAAVAAYDGYTFTTAVTVPDKNRALFFTTAGVALAYDWYAGQWATFTGTIFNNVKDAVVWSDSVVFGSDTGSLYQSSNSVYTDDGTAVSLMAGTGWYSPAGQQGYCQLHKLHVIGDYLAAHRLTVDVFFDYDDLKKRTYQIRPDTIVTATGDTKRYQFSLLVDKLCMSFRVRVRSSSDTNQALSLSGLRAEVALLAGTNRLPSIHKRH